MSCKQQNFFAWNNDILCCVMLKSSFIPPLGDRLYTKIKVQDSYLYAKTVRKLDPFWLWFVHNFVGVSSNS